MLKKMAAYAQLQRLADMSNSVNGMAAKRRRPSRILCVKLKVTDCVVVSVRVWQMSGVCAA